MEFQVKKKYGQNFITDNNLINKIVNSINITNNDLVIEVGPGMGALTSLLLSKAKLGLIYEIDKQLEPILVEKLSNYNNYKLNFVDFMNVDISKDIKNIKYDKLIFVSNLPYYITTLIVKKVIDTTLFDTILIMVQDEVANRFCASVNSREYGSLTVYINAFYNVKKLFKVDKKMFRPIPKVDSAIVCLEKKENIDIKNLSIFNKLVRDSFQFKRKTLKNNLKSYNLDLIEKILNKYNLSLNNRAEEVDVNIYIDIANNL